MEAQIPFSLLVASLAVAFFLYKLVKGSGNRQKGLALPPGPWKLPLIGNLHQLAGQLPHRALRDLSRKYGPIMTVRLGQVPAVVVCSPRLAREVMKTHDLSFADRPKPLATRIVMYDSTDVAFSPYGEYWRQMKKICTLELLSAKKVRSFGTIREKEVNRLLDTFRSSSGSVVDFSEGVVGMINTIVCCATFGDSCKDQDTLINLIKDLVRLASGFYVVDLFPKLEFLHVISGMKPTLIKMHKKLDKIFDDIFNERREKKSSGTTGEEDILDVLFRLKNSGSLEFPITLDNIKAIIMDLFSAGTDTTSITIDWAMAEMMRNPEIMKKAQDEVRRVFKGKKTITENDLQGLHYLKLVIKETLRKHPPGTLLLPRECRESCKIEGYDVPVKMKVIVNAWACAHDPEYWDEPEIFNPERFEGNTVDFMGADHQFIPFGAGRRMCPGISFGLITVEFPLAQMLYYFDWELPKGMKPEDVDMTETDGATANKKVPLHLVPTVFPI